MRKNGDGGGDSHSRTYEKRDGDGDAVKKVVKRVADEDDACGSMNGATFLMAVVPKDEFFNGEENQEAEQDKEKGCLDHVASAYLLESLDGFRHEIEEGDREKRTGGEGKEYVRPLGRPQAALEKSERGKERDDAGGETREDDVEESHRILIVAEASKLIYWPSGMRYFFVALLLFLPLMASAQMGVETNSSTREFRARVSVIEIDEEVDGLRHVVFEAQDEEGETYRIDTADSYVEGLRFDLREGRKVILQEVTIGGEADGVFFVDVVRTARLAWLFALFALAAVAVGFARGALAIVGLGVTLAVVFLWIFPRILGGADPLVTTVIGSVVILAVNMHLTHGFRRSTLLAFSSTVVGLGLVVLFAEGFTTFAHLSGLASEEATFLLFGSQGAIDPRGILLAGIVLGAVGVFDDIAVTQTETVEELQKTDARLTSRELFSRAMRVGRHHIASVVNTLVLAYAGVAMPLFLLFLLGDNIPGWRFVNEELVAEEIVRTLAGTMALVLLVPISTWFATWGKGQS